MKISALKRVMKKHSMKIFAAALMISGNTIGAGILGLPILGGMAGALPSIVGLTAIWMVMLGTAFVLAWRMISHGPEIKGLPSLFQKKLGSIVTLFGVEVVRKSNAALMPLLFVAFSYLIIASGKNVHPEWFRYTDWRFFPAVFPVFICAFTYHNTIPIVVRILDYDRPSVNKALMVGSAIPLILSLLWTLSVIGCLPLEGVGEDTLHHAFEKNFPATIPLAHILHSSVFTTISLFFS